MMINNKMPAMEITKKGKIPRVLLNLLSPIFILQDLSFSIFFFSRTGFEPLFVLEDL